MVAVDERQLSYFGPLEGGVMDVENLRLLELEPDARPAPHWVLTDITGARLHIPTTAEGADALFDVLRDATWDQDRSDAGTAWTRPGSTGHDLGTGAAAVALGGLFLDGLP